MDTSVKPGNQFYDYANGVWMRSEVIPPDRKAVSARLEAVLTTERQQGELIAGLLAGHPAPGSETAKIRDYDLAYRDTAAIERAGMAERIVGELFPFAVGRASSTARRQLLRRQQA